MADPSFVAWIDESGCDGSNFGKGSSEFLILTATVGYEAMACKIDATLGVLKHISGKTLPKFDKANPSAKWAACNLFTGIDFFTAHVMIHKPSIRSEALRTSRNMLYQFGSKFLVERISWICEALAHPHAPGDGTCRIVFSQDLSRSYDAFRAYLRTLSAGRNRHNTSIRWQHINAELVEALPAKSEPGLLLADYHASAMGLALERRMYGQFDCRFAEILGDKILKGDNGVFGMGCKLWPNEAEHLYNSDERFAWMKRV